MNTISSIAALRGALDDHRAAGRSVGFVPTMGFLHAGHASLMDAARVDNDVVVTSIFVNPLQFGPSEDLDSYPRDLTGDTALAEQAGVDLLFVPIPTEMYPHRVRTTVHVSGVSEPLEGRARPTHFDGVATVVIKLFAIVGPCRAYFGEKDFQQLAVVRQLVRDLSLPVEVIGCATVRDPDGLALSSRNAYLTPEERAAAPSVHAALQAGRRAIERGATSAVEVQRAIAAVIEAEPLAVLDYAAVVDAATFEVPDRLRGSLRLLVAARFGKARLIDNLGVEV
ncbi:MAG: pantoate--beta-alanine ligase [Microthrixaceae bacterium]